MVHRSRHPTLRILRLPIGHAERDPDRRCIQRPRLIVLGTGTAEHPNLRDARDRKNRQYRCRGGAQVLHAQRFCVVFLPPGAELPLRCCRLHQLDGDSERL